MVATEEGYLKWSDVVKIHGTQEGISVKNGKLNSILFSNSPSRRMYSNTFNEKYVDYVVPFKRNYQAAFSDSLENGTVFPLYKKIYPNKWLLLGVFRVSEELGKTLPDGKLYRLSRID